MDTSFPQFFERGYLIAASAGVPFAIWLSFNAFVPSIGHFNACFASGNQYPQLDSNFAKHSSHSVTLRRSCLCVSSFVRLNIRSTLNSNACRLSGIQLPNQSSCLWLQQLLSQRVCHPILLPTFGAFSHVGVQYSNRCSTRTNLTHSPNFWFELHQLLALLCVAFFKHFCRSRMLHSVPFFLFAFHLFR